MDSLRSFLTNISVKYVIQTIQFTIDLFLETIVRMLSFRVFRFEILVSLSIYLFPQTAANQLSPALARSWCHRSCHQELTVKEDRKVKREITCLQPQTSEYREETEKRTLSWRYLSIYRNMLEWLWKAIRCWAEYQKINRYLLLCKWMGRMERCTRMICMTKTKLENFK